jgi:hypothetical protein
MHSAISSLRLSILPPSTTSPSYDRSPTDVSSAALDATEMVAEMVAEMVWTKTEKASACSSCIGNNSNTQALEDEFCTRSRFACTHHDMVEESPAVPMEAQMAAEMAT